MNEQPLINNSLSSRKLIGSAVHSVSGENLGKIEAFLLNPKNGTISSVILTTGGLIGKRIAVPWDMVVMNEAERSISINVDQDFISRLPPYTGEF